MEPATNTDSCSGDDLRNVSTFIAKILSLYQFLCLLTTHTQYIHVKNIAGWRVGEGNRERAAGYEHARKLTQASLNKVVCQSFTVIIILTASPNLIFLLFLCLVMIFLSFSLIALLSCVPGMTLGPAALSRLQASSRSMLTFLFSWIHHYSFHNNKPSERQFYIFFVCYIISSIFLTLQVV